MLIPRHSIIKKSSNQLFSSRRFDVPNGYSSRCTLSKARAEFGNPCSFPSPPFLLSLSFSLSTPPAYYSRALCFLSFRFRLINSIPLSLSLSRLLGPTHSLIPPFSSSFHLGLLFSYFAIRPLLPFLRFPFLSRPLFLPFIRAQRYAQTISYYFFPFPFLFFPLFSFHPRIHRIRLFPFTRIRALFDFASPSFLPVSAFSNSKSRSLSLSSSFSSCPFVLATAIFYSSPTVLDSSLPLFHRVYFIARAMIDVVCLLSSISLDPLPRQRDHLSLYFAPPRFRRSTPHTIFHFSRGYIIISVNSFLLFLLLFSPHVSPPSFE